MPDLTELQRLAEQGQWMPPDTAKKVIAVALAAEMLYADTLDYIRVNNLGDPNNYGMRAVHTALEELK